MTCRWCEKPSEGAYCSPACEREHWRVRVERLLHVGKLAEAREMMSHAETEHGSGMAAARALGVPIRTWYRWASRGAP